MPRRFVLVDRDGTINHERHYLSDPEQLELCPNAGAGLRRMLELGLGLVVITNQSAIGRGKFKESRLHEIHDRLRQLLRADGVLLHGIYFCPHLPEDQCACRKPLTGLAQQAARDFGFSLPESFVIGDKNCDLELGKSVNATSLLVRTGYGVETARGPHQADEVVEDLLHAANVIEDRLEIDSRRALNAQPVKLRLWTA